MRAGGFAIHASLNSEEILAADIGFPILQTVLGVLTEVWAVSLGLIRQPEAGQRHAGEADAEFLQRRAARDGLGQIFR